MEGKGTLTLDLLDVYGDHLKDRFDVFMKHTVLSNAPVFKNQDAAKQLLIQDLDSTQGGLYSLLVYPTSYRPVSRFVRIEEGTTVPVSLTLPIVPEKVTRVDFPAYSSLPDDLSGILETSDVEGNEGTHGEDLYRTIEDVRKAGLLNLYWKMQHTTFLNERNVFSYMSALTRIRGDRFFATVQKDLRDTVKNSINNGLFHKVDGSLHTPPPNFVLADSFKTNDHYGNLQLTFFSNPSTLDFVVDADIDDAQGIEHIFQVLHNAITGNPTHPYNIHEILVAYQKIDPQYKLFV
jgi:hypothetical protein